MATIVFDLADVFGFSFPSTFHLPSAFPNSKKILAVMPEIEALAVEKIVFEMTIVILCFGKYGQADAVSSTIYKCAVIDIFIYGISLTAYFSSEFLNWL